MIGKIDTNLLGNYAIDGPGGSNIKSIQRGTTTMTAVTMNVTITGINLNAAIVKIKVKHGTNAGGPDTVKAILTTTTNLALTIGCGSAESAVVNWEIIEFYNVKSIQQGTKTFTSGGSATQAITSVNTNKSYIEFSFTTSAYNPASDNFFIGGELTNSTTLTFTSADVTNTKTIAWQVIEFN